MEPDGKFLYGCGMRLMEVVRLWILNFDYRQILVRSGKGKKDRVVPTPEKLVIPLQKQIESASKLYQDDKELGFGSVHIPEALFRKYTNAKMELKWHYVFFPATAISTDLLSGKRRCHHIHETSLQKTIKTIAEKKGILKSVTGHI